MMETPSPLHGRSLTASSAGLPAASHSSTIATTIPVGKGASPLTTVPTTLLAKDGAPTAGGVEASVSPGSTIRNKRTKSAFVPRPSQKLKGSTVKKFLGVSSSSNKGGLKPTVGLAGDASNRRKLSIEETGSDTSRNPGSEKVQQIESFARVCPTENLFSKSEYLIISNMKNVLDI